MKLRTCAISILLLLIISADTAYAGSLVRIYVSPGNVALAAGVKQQFFVAGVDCDGNNVPVDAPVTWEADPAAGTITPDGVFTASGTVGVYDSAIKASVEGGIFSGTIVEIVAAVSNGGYAFERAWRSGAPIPANAMSVAVGPDASIYVLEPQLQRILKLDSHGNYITRFVNPLIGMFTVNPSVGLVVDSDGRMYSSDTEGCCVVVLDAQGKLVQTIGSTGTADGQFRRPRGIARDSAGNLYVVDAENDRVQKFNSAGEYLSQWGSQGSGNGQFNSPWGIAIDASGSVYVTDYGNERVQKFDSSGNFISVWGTRGAGDGQFYHPEGIAVNDHGYIYVADNHNCRIQKFDASGHFIAKWGKNGISSRDTPYPVDLAVAPDGTILVACSTVKRFDSDGRFIECWGNYLGTMSELRVPCGITLDSDGNLLISDLGAGLMKATTSGRILQRFYTSGGKPLMSCSSAVSAQGDIYSSGDSGLITCLSSDGGIINYWGPYGNKYGFVRNCNIALDAAGNVHVLDFAGLAVWKFSSTGEYITKTPMAQPMPNAMCILRSGDICMAYSDRVRQYDAQYNLRSEWSVPLGMPSFNGSGISLGPDGTVLVAGYDDIWIFDQNGELITRWYEPNFRESSYGGLVRRGIVAASDGAIYTTDSTASSVRKYVPAYNQPKDVKACGDGSRVTLANMVVTMGTDESADGTFYVESRDRSIGICVQSGSGPRGRNVVIDGYLQTINGERCIVPVSIDFFGSSTIEPLAMPIAAIGGGKLGYQEGVNGWKLIRPDPKGPWKRVWGLMGSANNIGLLVKTWGRVKSVDSTARTFIIDDGSGQNLQCRFGRNVLPPAVDNYVTVTGISSCYQDKKLGLCRLFKIRVQTDIEVIKPAKPVK